MHNFIPEIRKIAERVVKSESRRKGVADFLRSIGEEKGLIFRNSPETRGSLKVAAVDGGIVKKSFHGMDCALVRSAGVCFTYSGKKVASVDYYPSKFPAPEPSIGEAMQDLDWAYHTSAMRLRSEIRNAIGCAEKFSPDMLLLDGSILPHYSDKPSKASIVYPLYEEVVDLYTKLFRTCEEKGIVLCGVIEDSRSTRFCEMVKSKALTGTDMAHDSEIMSMLEKTKDTNLLYWALDKGERSMEFIYSDSPKEHPILKDFEGYWQRIYAFYLKTAKWDRPVRVEFLGSGNPSAESGRISSMLLAISGQHDVYGLPTPLIEADSVAKLSESEIESLYSQILSITGNIPSMFRLRRDQRPF